MQEFHHVGGHNNVTLIAHLHATGGTIPRTGGAGLSFSKGNCVPYSRPGCKEEDGTEEGLCQFKDSAPPGLYRKCLLAERLCTVHVPHRLGLRHSHTRSGFRTDTTVKSLR